MTALKRLKSSDPQFAAQLAALLAFEGAQDPAIDATVAGILADVRQRGDAAVLEYTRRFDRLQATSVAQLEFTRDEMQRALAALNPAQRNALEQAAARVRTYHEKQVAQSWSYTDEDGTRLGQQVSALDRVGIYVPGGKAAYPSSVLMNALPAKVAGVREIIMVVPTPGGEKNALVLAAAELAGVDRVFGIGGAQAIGALAYGTATVPQVDKIVGPGNAYVAAAKRRVFGIVGIDMVAGTLGNPDRVRRQHRTGLDRDGPVLAGRARRARAGDSAGAGRPLPRGSRGEHRAPADRHAPAGGDQGRAGEARRADRSARPRRGLRDRQPDRA
jgi:histidinol dehydrogenase